MGLGRSWKWLIWLRIVAYEAGAGASCLICGRPDSKITDGSDATNRLDSVNKLKKPI